MSLTTQDRVSASSAAASELATGEARAPVLKSGAHYAGWMPSMDVYLQKHGAHDVHREPLTEEDWILDEKDVIAWEKESLVAARAALRGARGAESKAENEPAGDEKSSSSSPVVVSAVLSAEQKAARATVAANVERSRKAFGTIFNALPEDMRALVAHIPRGWAYGLWMWLERKYQSTEADNVNTLWGEWMSLVNPADESWDAWRARVNKIFTLLKHAKEEPSPAMYCFVMLDRLHARFKPAVLALKNGNLLKNKAAIDWEEVSALLNAHDRDDRQTAANAASADASAMAAQTKSYYGLVPGGENKAPTTTGAKYPGRQERRGSDSSNNGRDRERYPRKETRTCYKCDKVGHISRDCKSKGKKPDGGSRDEQASSAIAASAKPKGPQEYGLAAMVKPAAGAKKNSPTKVAEKKKVQTSNKYETLRELNDGAEPDASGPSEQRKVRFDLRKELLGSKNYSKSVNEKQKEKAGSKGSAKAMAVTAPMREFGIDSMASVHLSGNKAIFIKGSLKECPVFPVTVADRGVVEVSQVGSVELNVNVAPGQTVTFIIKDVCYNPRFGANLLGLHALTKSGWEFHCTEADTYLLTPNQKLKVRLDTERRLSVLQCAGNSSEQGVPGKVFSVVSLEWGKVADLVQLHERLGHMGFDKMIRVIKADKTEGIGKLNVSAAVLQDARKRVLECRACTQGKGSRTAFGHRGLDRGRAPGECLHMDTYYVKFPLADGTTHVEYGLTISCPFSSFRWSGRLSRKSDGAQVVITIINNAQKQFDCKVKRLHTDGGTEFVNRTLKDFCAKEGIELHYPPAETPQLNSIAERSVRSGKDAARTLLMHCGLPTRFGPRAVFHANYVWNRTHVSPATGVTPYEAMVKKKPSIGNVGVFGCDVYYHIPKEKRGTLDAKMLPGIYLGHKYGRDGSVVYDLQSGSEIVTRDVKFFNRRFTHAAALKAGGDRLERILTGACYEGEDTPPEEAESELPSSPLGSVFGDTSDEVYDVERIVGRRVRNGRTEYEVKWTNYEETTWEPADNVELGAEEEVEKFLAGQSQSVQPAAEPAAVEEKSDDDEPIPSHLAPPRPVVDSPPAATVPSAGPAAEEKNSGRRSARNHPSSLALDAAESKVGQHHVHMAMSAVSGLLPGGDDRLSSDDTEMVCAVASGLSVLEGQTPNTWKEAMASPDSAKWRAAADKEMAGCERMGVWERVPRSSVPKDQVIITTKWVFKIKTDSSGAVDVYKARLTPKGFLQREGINYHETFAATAKYKSLRLALCLTAMFDNDMDQMDVPQAFLNADLDDLNYMEIPEPYRVAGEDMVFKLKKALYGLKQSPRKWYLLISKFVAEELGYKPTVSDPCLFFKRSRTGKLMLLFLFVDDFQSSFNREDRAEWNELKKKLIDRFQTKDLGESNWILGMRITRDRKARTIHLDQELYVTKALERYGMKNCKPVATPCVHGATDVTDDSDDAKELEKNDPNSPVDLQLYQEMVGTLMYAAVSCRPDTSYAVQQLARAMQAPTQQHMVAAKRVFRYLAGTKDVGLSFGTHSGEQVASSRGSHNPIQLDVCSYADADWANDKKDRKSITGWVAKVNGDCISWASKKQRTVAQSTCEAELYAEAAAIQEVLWMRGLLKELGLHVQTGSAVFGDNQSTIAVSQNGVRSERTKHVDVKYHFITETIVAGEVKLHWVPSAKQQADIFTKALPKPAFLQFRKELMTR